jgi:hypothetical protein
MEKRAMTQQLAQAIATSLFNTIVIGLTNLITQWYKQLVNFITGQQIVLTTGAGVTFQQPIVIRFWQTNVTVVDAALALLILWIAYNVTLGVYDPLQMLSRIILATVAAHASIQFVGLFVTLNNALCASAIQAAGLPNISDLAALLGVPVAGVNETNILQFFIISAMSGVVVLQMIVRVGVLDLLIVLLPLFMLLLVSPTTQPFAGFGISAFFAVLFLQFLQVTAIALGAALVATFGQTFSFVSTLAGIAVLTLVLKIPGWLGSAISSSIGSVRSPFGYAASAAREAAQGFLTLVKTVL